MIDLEDLHKTWSIIEKNNYMKTDAQVINFYRAVQYWKAIVIDAIQWCWHSKNINLLFNMMAEAQEKAFRTIVK